MENLTQQAIKQIQEKNYGERFLNALCYTPNVQILT
jgi:hypothetical protein